MKPNELLMYIIDNKVIIWSNKKNIIEETFKKSLYHGKIYKSNEFVKNLEEIIKKYKLNNGLFNNNITVITEPNYNDADNETLKSCLEKLSLNKITIKSIITLCTLKKNNVWILANETYMYINSYDYRGKIQNIFVDYRLYKKNLSTLAIHLSTLIKKKKTIIFGFYNKIDDLANIIEKNTKTKVYYIEDTKSFIIKQIKNTL